MSDGAAPADRPVDDAAARGVEALQAAAREMITAARAALDVAEDLVSDPGAAGGALAVFAGLARDAAQAATSASGRAHRGARSTGGDGDDEGGDDGGVQRIPVS